MGWLYMESMGEHKTPKQYLDAQFTFENERRKLTVLDSASKLGAYYAAVESIAKATGEREVFGLVCLTNYRPRGFSDGTTFGYKDMDESMGPNQCECPVRLLDLLTPTTSDYANDWRKRCRERAAKRVPKPGETFTLAKPMRFTDGQHLSKFRAIRSGNRTVYASLENGGYYRISRIRDRELTVATS
jgi:hypothetical protein